MRGTKPSLKTDDAAIQELLPAPAWLNEDARAEWDRVFPSLAARRILTEKAQDHEKLSQALLEYETLSGEEIKDLLEKGVAPNRDENNFPNAGPSVAVPVTPVSDGTEIAVPVAKPAATSVPTVH